MSQRLMMNRKWILLLLFILIFVVVRFLRINTYLSFHEIKENRDTLLAFAHNHYITTVFAYIALYATEVAFLLPIAAVLTITGGFLFGTILGALYANIGATIGAMCSFLLVRYVIGRSIQKRYSLKLIRFNRAVKKHGTPYLLFIQFVAIIPFFIAS